MPYSQNLADLRKQVEDLAYSDFIPFSSEEMHHFRESLAFSDPGDFPDEFDLVRTLQWHKFHQLDQQRFILKHRRSGQYLRVTVNRTPDGVIGKNDIRQVKKHYEIQAVYE